MDNFREVTILANTQIGDSGTRTIDLDVTQPITEMQLEFKVTNNAVAKDVPPVSDISKIEIVDGGKVYWSTEGHETIGAYCYDVGFYPACDLNEDNGAAQRNWIPLRFGRYIGDEEFAFSPSKMLNPQLKITWSKNALHTTAAVYLCVMATVMEGVSPPMKALFWKNFRTFTSVATGIESTDLPVDVPYRRLGIRYYGADAIPGGILTHFKMDCDVGAKIVFDEDARWALNRNCQGRPMIHINKRDAIAASGESHNSWISWRTLTQGTGQASNVAVNCPSHFNPRYTVFLTDLDNTAITGSVQIIAQGWMPEQMMVYDFGRPNEPATWFPCNKYKNVKLELTQGIADVPIQISLQQAVSQP